MDAVKVQKTVNAIKAKNDKALAQWIATLTEQEIKELQKRLK